MSTPYVAGISVQFQLVRISHANLNVYVATWPIKLAAQNAPHCIPTSANEQRGWPDWTLSVDVPGD